jgi:hypothetical protein
LQECGQYNKAARKKNPSWMKKSSSEFEVVREKTPQDGRYERVSREVQVEVNKTSYKKRKHGTRDS